MKTKTLFGYALCLAGLLAGTSPAHPELSLHQDRISLHVQAVPLEEVLVDLSREAGFRVTILKAPATKDTMVSERFDALPIEEGLARLLAGWNYGLVKQPESEHIQELFLVSKRMRPEDLSIPASAPTPVRDSESRQNWGEDYETLAAFTGESPDKEYLEDHDAEEFEEEGFEGNQDAFNEEMIPEDLPQEMREAMLEDLARMNDQ